MRRRRIASGGGPSAVLEFKFVSRKLAAKQSMASWRWCSALLALSQAVSLATWGNGSAAHAKSASGRSR